MSSEPENLPVPPGSAVSPPEPPVMINFAALNIQNTPADDDDEEEGDEEDADSDGLVQLPASVMRRVIRLKQLQEERDTVFDLYKAERCKLEKKFREQYDALYTTRQQVVVGEIDIQPEDGEEAQDDEDDGGADITGIPHFWLNAMSRHEALADLIHPPDHEALAALTDIKCIDQDDLMGFTLEFHFSPNPFFTDAVLTKTYETANLLDQGEPLLESVKASEVHWKPKKNLCEKQVKQKSQWRNKRRGGGGPPPMKTKKVESFFKFFLEPTMAEMEEEDEDEETEQPYELNYEMDYEVALVFRNHIVPNAVLWFTGEAVSDDMEDEEGEEEEGEDDGDEEDEGDEGGGEPEADAAAGGENPNPECKQS